MSKKCEAGCGKRTGFYNFATGVPGTLAFVANAAHGIIVERCDTCSRFKSDAAALRAVVRKLEGRKARK